MTTFVALIVDDEPDLCDLLALTLNKMHITTHTAHTITHAKAILNKQKFDLCLTDMRLPDGNGLDLVAYSQNHYPNMPIAVITAHGNVESAIKALKWGAFDFISKPIELAAFRNIIQDALRTHSVSHSVFSEQLIGQSAVMQHLKSQIIKISRSQAPIFITGPSGSGKELVARIIHQESVRRHGPFIPVNCGAIPQELVESEFFGHLKGSFTGATHDKIGFFQAANNGTLFLDEIAELPLSMQVKLLRAIQERKIRPVGSPNEIAVDVRILSATHKNLHLLIQQNLFRHDLFYRIHVIEITVPSLSQRTEDILLLAEHFITKHAASTHTTLPHLSQDAKQSLLAYAFPGNVRELENIIERALALSEGPVIETHDLQLLSSGEMRTTTASIGAELPLDVCLIQKEREIIQDALQKTHGNKTAAAKLLGISFRTLRYRLKKLGEDSSSFDQNHEDLP